MNRVLFPVLTMALLVFPDRTLPATGVPAMVNDGYGDYVYVPAGAFKMGDNFGDGESRERPVHTVDLDAYYIGKYEVTNGEWRKFRDDPGYDNPKFWPGNRPVPKNQVPYWTDARNHGGGTADSDAYPVLGVNWDSAVAYCNWLSAKTGKTYRLPTEAEWEKAGPRNRPAALRVGKLDRPYVHQLCGCPNVRYRLEGRYVRRLETWGIANP